MFLPLYALKTDPQRLGIHPGSNVELVTARYVRANHLSMPELYVYVFDTPAQAEAAAVVMNDQGDENNQVIAGRAANGCGILVVAMLDSTASWGMKIYDRRRLASDKIEASWTTDEARAAVAMQNITAPDNMAQALASIVAEAALVSGVLQETQREMEKFDGASVSFVSLTQEQLRNRNPDAAQLQTLSTELIQYGMAAEAGRETEAMPDPALMDLRVLQTLSKMMPQAPQPE